MCISDKPSVFVCCVVFHDQVRRQVSQSSRRRGSSTHESIPPDSAIDPQVTSLLDVRCKRIRVSRLVVIGIGNWDLY